MFLVAVTAQDLGEVAAGAQRTVETVGDRRLTVITDGTLGRVLTTPASVIATEGGDAALSRVRFDRASGRLEITRLMAGGRPIYHTLTPAGEFYCSTHPAMLRRMAVPLRERTESLPELFVYCTVTPPRSVFQGIDKLPWGASLFLDVQRPVLRPEVRHASALLAVGGDDGDLGRAVTGTLERLEQALAPATRSRPAALLSGGLDSTILTVAAARVADVGETYSTGYPFEDHARNTEKDYAVSAAAALGVAHRYHEPAADAYLHGLIDAIAAVEEPLYGLQSVLLGSLFRDGIPSDRSLVLCGQGADGLFGLDIHEAVFRSRQGRRLAWRLASRPAITAATWWAAASRAGEYAVHRLTLCWRQKTSLDDPRHLIWDMQRFGDAGWARAHFGVSDEAIIAGRRAAIEPFASHDLLDLISVLDVLADVGTLQFIWSKLGEASGRAVFYPYTTDELVRHAVSLPWSVKLGAPRPVTKAVLRGVARTLGVPVTIVDRPKSGFGVSPARWATPGALEPLVPLVSGVFPAEAVHAVQTTDPHRSRIYWNMLNYGIWRRLVIDDEPPARLHDELTGALEQSHRRQTA